MKDRKRMLRVRSAGWLLLLLAGMATSCSPGEPLGGDVTSTGTSSHPAATATGPSATVAQRSTPDLSAIDSQIRGDIRELLDRATSGFDQERVQRLGQTGDVRVAWFVSDMLRFADNPSTRVALEETFATLFDLEPDTYRGWTEVTNYLIAQDVPAPDGYRSWKRALYLKYEPGWAPFFSDADADVDWRLISWGGVEIDDRPINPPNIECFTCIPALNDPAVTDTSAGDWYPDEAIVFGVEVNGEVRAYPKHQMEVHEMVNDTLGGRRIAIVYCTLCGSAQAFVTDELPAGIETPTGNLELRTSGLLSRSNKVMFEYHTDSYFDTFRGRAVSGPLQDAEFVLEPLSVHGATWGEWRDGHPQTTILASDGGIGWEYSFDPLGGRDDAGPIFPIGDVDPRLPVQDLVLGVVHGDVTVAFPEVPARSALGDGRVVEFRDIVVEIEAGALTARTADGEAIPTHQAFWFAWSQFRPDTQVWGVDG